MVVKAMHGPLGPSHVVWRVVQPHIDQEAACSSEIPPSPLGYAFMPFHGTGTLLGDVLHGVIVSQCHSVSLSAL